MSILLSIIVPVYNVGSFLGGRGPFYQIKRRKIRRHDHVSLV